MRKKLDKITLVLVDTKNYGNALNSLQKSLEQIEPFETLFFTDIDLQVPLGDIKLIKIPTINSKEEYSQFIVKELWKHINSDYVLVSQWDGWVLNGEAWNDRFYLCDYVGSPWLYTDGRNIGNGGFSLRSQKLMAILGNDSFIEVTHPEDDITGRLYRGYLIAKYKIKFPTDELADRFAYELRAPVFNTFGFHGFFHTPYRETIIITRMGALGDVIALEPLLHYYYKRGYKVVLNTSDPFFGYFVNHYFKIHHPRDLDGRVQPKEINLDHAYESYPKQLHLKSYFQMCGIPESEWEIRNPKLTLEYDYKTHRLFNKYVVLHLDIREQASRNIEGIDWESVVKYIKELGYDVLQIGIGKHDEVKGAIFMNTPSEALLMAIIGSAELVIGIDSAPTNIAVSMNTRAVIFSGSVDLRYIIPDMIDVTWIHNHDKRVCEKPFCWADTRGCVGTKCYIDDNSPPCNKFSTIEVMNKIKELL